MKRGFLSPTVLTFAVVLWLLGFATERSAKAASFTGLSDLTGGSFSSQAWDVSADGLVVVGRGTSSSGTEAFRWTEGGGMEPLGYLSGTSYSIANAVSADGSVVVGESGSGPADFPTSREAFRWEGGLMTELGFEVAYGVSADGSVVVGKGSGYGIAVAEGVSADGSVVVGGGPTALGWEALRWEGGVTVGLGDFPGGEFKSGADGVSADGSVVVGVGQTATGDEAFRWTESTGMVPLGDFSGGGFDSYALDVSDASADGSVIVGRGQPPSAGFKALIWDAARGTRFLYDVLVNDFGLDLTDWTLETASGISDDGLAIVGWGTNPSGDREAWMAKLDPLPPPVGVILNNGFEVGLWGWTVSGEGTADVIEFPASSGNFVAELITETSIILSQDIDTPSIPFYITFEYLFETTTGSLDVLLNSFLLDTILAPATLLSSLTGYSLLVSTPTFLGLNDVPLTFRLNHGSTSQILLEDIGVEPIPEPATLFLLGSGLAGLGFVRRRRRAA